MKWSQGILEGGRYDEKVGYSKNSFLPSRLDSIKLTYVNIVDKSFVLFLI
jgi:hypothetical protein